MKSAIVSVQLSYHGMKTAIVRKRKNGTEESWPHLQSAHPRPTFR